MIVVEILNDSKKYKFHDKRSALRFMYTMKSKGYFIIGWTCEDPYDNEWLWIRFKH